MCHPRNAVAAVTCADRARRTIRHFLTLWGEFLHVHVGRGGGAGPGRRRLAETSDQETRRNFWKVWQVSGASPRLTANVCVTSATYTSPRESTAML